MRRLVLIGGIAAVLLPGLAMADPSCHEKKNDSRAVGTVVGAGLGALIGGAVGKGTGAIAGAVGGGVVGNVAGGASVDCQRTGYYDRDGVWRAPVGHYDGDGRWVATGPTGGYYDSYGHWVATAPTGDGADVSYTGRVGGIDAREDSLGQRIQARLDGGYLSREDADRDFDQLSLIRRREARMRSDHDSLTRDDQADLDARLDDLSNDIGER